MYLYQSQRGFSIMELMLVVVVLGFGICIILGGFLNSLSNFKRIQNRLEVIEFLNSKLKELELENLKKGLSEGEEEGEFKVKGRVFKWNAKISFPQKPSYLEKKAYLVELNVQWLESGIKKVFSLQTYLIKRTAQ